ncbi:hemicentin-1-like isoform X2 [Cydia pomonella]|uniref:hemicentin-1-like isoform X2 n=1 Tax=Cydia pomonella TaxID=82600 RepID=UPI002ADD5E78|nr:hemicentin-1-like isoform X2 [Cydia pomonella]
MHTHQAFAMAVKLLLPLAFLITEVSCGQNSLAFVIDHTYSMHNVITEVQGAAKSIMDIVLEAKKSQIEDIVLVTFGDPEVTFRIKTRDEAVLKRALDTIDLHGGGDCPEMALGGIKMGLEESRPGSYIYLFTDASAKDYKRYKEIKTFSQEKQSEIFFVLTGDCDDISQPTFKVYDALASASNGQVLRVTKAEVQQLLEYVKETIMGERVVISSTNVPAGAWKEVKFNIDKQIEYAVVSASGSNVSLKIYDPKSDLKTGTNITWTQNVKITKITNLELGTYTAKVKGNSHVNILVFGRTDFTIQHGFSTEVEPNLNATDTLPTTGVETHLMISVQGKTNSTVIREVELVDMRDQLVMRLPLTHVHGNVYTTDKFLPPKDTFKIAIVATEQSSGSTIKRSAKTPVTSIEPVAPKIAKIEDVIKIKEGVSIDIHCSIIQGKPRPQISWYIKEEGETAFNPLPGKDEVYHVAAALTNDQYKCVAKNVKAEDEHIVTLDVKTAPKFQNTPLIISKNIGEPVTIECSLQKGKPRPRVTWQFKPQDTTVFTPLEYEGELLTIGTTQLSQAGDYRCIATNTDGRDEKTTTLLVKANPTLEKPTISIEENKKSTMENSNITLRCRVTGGFPKLTVNWLYKGQYADKYTTIVKNSESIILKNIQQSDAGQYKCVAKNDVGEAEQVVELVVNAAPKFQDTPPIISKNIGEPVSIECSLQKGNPRPRVTWQFNPQNTTEIMPLEHEGELLTIGTAQLSQAGDYRCLATNTEGRDEKTTTLLVKAKSPSKNLTIKQTAMENATISLNCRVAKGFPASSVKWFYKGRYADEFEMIFTRSEKVILTNIQPSEAGQYKCVVENGTDKTEQVIDLVIYVGPKFRKTPNVITKSEGEPVIIDCTLQKGSPQPKITWQFKPQDTTEFVPLEHEGGLLTIGTTQLSQAGEYRCLATSTEGCDEKTTTLVVKELDTLRSGA